MCLYSFAECIATAEPQASSSTQQSQQQEDVGFVSKRSVRLQRSFPLTAVIGQDHIKQALLLGACDTGVYVRLHIFID